MVPLELSQSNLCVDFCRNLVQGLFDGTELTPTLSMVLFCQRQSHSREMTTKQVTPATGPNVRVVLATKFN